MKTALIADVHFGIRNDNPVVLERQVQFFKEKFCPYLREHDISNVIVLGDWFDRRKVINIKTLQATRDVLSDLILSCSKLFMVVGNHDTYYRSTIELNSFNELYPSLPLLVIDRPTEIDLGKKKFLMVPWIVPEDQERIMSIISSSRADICCGHFEIIGAKMMANLVCQHGLDHSTFSNFEYTFSGHFHVPSDYYVGSPLQYTWSDYGDRKRFLVYDDETNSVEEVLTGDNSFVKLFYDNGQVSVKPECESFDGKTIKIIVEHKDDPYQFEKYLETVLVQNPLKVDVMENYLHQTADEDVDVMCKDTLSIVMESVEEMEIAPEDVERLKGLFNSLYIEALEAK